MQKVLFNIEEERCINYFRRLEYSLFGNKYFYNGFEITKSMYYEIVELLDKNPRLNMHT